MYDILIKNASVIDGTASPSFDPSEISDRATYEKPHQYAKGIFHVIVNGNLVVHEAAHSGARPGRILKID